MNAAALLAAFAAAAAVLGIGLLVAMLIAGARNARLQRRYEGGRGATPGTGVVGHPDWVERFAASGERLNRSISDPGETRILLAQAGWRDARARAGFYALQFGLPLFCGLIALLLFGSLGALWGSLRGVLLVAVVIILALLAPRYILRSKAKKRRERLAREVPLFINVLVLLFEAGLNLRQALNSLVRDGGPTMPTLTDELAPLMRQIEAGADADELLRETGRLLAIEELDTVFGILRQVERYGGEIREPLVETLDTLQAKRSMELRVQVNVMSGKMTVVLVTCFFPPLLVFIAGPAFMSIAATLGNL